LPSHAIKLSLPRSAFESVVRTRPYLGITHNEASQKVSSIVTRQPVQRALFVSYPQTSIVKTNTISLEKYNFDRNITLAETPNATNQSIILVLVNKYESRVACHHRHKVNLLSYA